jgi:hypothetical protein
MKSRIIIESEGVVKVRFDHSECDVFLMPEKLPVSDIELIDLVRKYHRLACKKMR